MEQALAKLPQYRKHISFVLHFIVAAYLSTPIISISLGDTGIFVLGGKLLTDDTKQYIVRSGDVIVMGGKS